MKVAYGFFVFFIVCVFIFLGIHNFNDADFLNVSLYNILTTAIAIVISFLLVQRKTNQRKYKDQAEAILDRFCSLLMVLNTSLISGEYDYQEMLSLKKELNNILLRIDSFKEDLSIKNEVEMIKKQFDDYEAYIDIHLQLPANYKSQSAYLNKFIITIRDQSMGIKLSFYK